MKSESFLTQQTSIEQPHLRPRNIYDSNFKGKSDLFVLYIIPLDFIKNIPMKMCVPKMNEDLMGLERHEGESLVT